MKRKNTGYRDGWYCPSGGHIDKGESVADAAIREADEELGIRVRKSGLRIVNILYKLEKGDSAIIFIVRPRKWSGKVRNAPIPKTVSAFLVRRPSASEIPDHASPKKAIMNKIDI